MKTAPTEVTRTYLEMRSPDELQSWRSDDPRISIERLRDCSSAFYRHLYVKVGANYHWIDRLPWTDEQIEAHLNQPEISLWLMTYEGRGFGKHLLTCATEQAWFDGANRVWLHTCTLDDKAAMPNYLSRGFQVFKSERYALDLPE